jgi:hypothetical protein
MDFISYKKKLVWCIGRCKNVVFHHALFFVDLAELMREEGKECPFWNLKF